MHENLKYTFRLDESIKAFETFDGKNPNDINDKAEIADWQPIYANNHYGTQYFIYAKLIGQPVNEGFQVNKTQIYLQNYSGCVSIGLNGYAAHQNQHPLDSADPDNDPRFPTRSRHKLTIGLEGLKMDSIVDTLSLAPFVIKHGDVLMIQPIFTPAKPELSHIFEEERFHTSSFVDDLFMERMGDDIFISDTGASLLIDLYELNLVSRLDLLNAGINVNDETFMNKTANYKKVALLGKHYPCIPMYSICYCK